MVDRMKNEEYGSITVTEKMNEFGVEGFSYSWSGGRKVIITYSFFNLNGMYVGADNDVVQIGPYRLHIIERSVHAPVFVCVRMDYPLWRLVEISYHIKLALQVLKSKLIMTLHVWGLARFSHHAIPCWSDIHFIRWIKNRLKI